MVNKSLKFDGIFPELAVQIIEERSMLCPKCLKDGKQNRLEVSDRQEIENRIFMQCPTREEMHWELWRPKRCINSIVFGILGSFIQTLVDARALARKIKDWEIADEIRQSLFDLGIKVKDDQDGTTWERRWGVNWMQTIGMDSG